MSLKVELQNIGGLRGKHSFSFKEGLNMIKSPNATGKTSLLNALFLLIGNEQIPKSELEDYLTDNEVAGYVQLLDSKGKKSEIRLTRDISKGVNLTKIDINPDLKSDLAYFVIFLRDKSKLNQGIQMADDIMIENWFLEMTKVNIFHSVWVTAQELLHQIEINVDILTEKQQEDIEPIEKLIQEKNNSLKDNKRRKQEIIDDPTNQKNQRRIKELTKELKDLNGELRELKYKILDRKDKQEPEYKKKYQDIKTQINLLQEELKNIESKREVLLIEKKEWEKKLISKSNEIKVIKKKNTEQGETKREVTNEINRLEKLKDRSVCPLCDSEINKQGNKELLEKNKLQLKKLTDDEVKFETKLKTSKNEMKIAQDKIKEIEQEIKYSPEAIEDDINANNNKLKEIEKLLNQIKNEELELEHKTNKIEQNIFTKEKELKNCLNPEVQEEIERISYVISDEETEIAHLQLKKTSYLKNNLELSKMKKRLIAAEKITSYYRNRVETIRKNMVKKINNKLEKSFKLLKLAELERITLDPDHFKLDIQRIDKTYTSLEKMSGAERALISLIISYIVKSTLLPKIPIFLIDEVTSEMDDTRFEDTINSISNEIPYLIVSRHIPFKGEKTIISSKDIMNNF